MRIAKILIVVLLLAAPIWVRAQAPRPAATAPEVFTATAQAKNATGAVSGIFEARVSRYTPDFDRGAVETELRLGGYPRFLIALRKAPEVGQLIVGGSKPYAIRYAREKIEAGARTIVLVTDRPVYFIGGGQGQPTKPREGFEVSVVQIQIDATGKGSGTMAGAARVRPDVGDGVRLDDYADQPIALTGVTRKPS